MGVYLDAGSHVGLDGKPCYYDGVLNLYQPRSHPADRLDRPQGGAAGRGPFHQRPQGAAGRGRRHCQHLLSPLRIRPQGVLGRRQFRARAPTRRARSGSCRLKSRRRRRKSPTRAFETWIRFIKRFPEVQFITASEAAKLYRDRARGRKFTFDGPQSHRGGGRRRDQLSEMQRLFAVRFRGVRFAQRVRRGTRRRADAGQSRSEGDRRSVRPEFAGVADGTTTDWSQFSRTAADVADFVRKQHRVPGTVWLGSKPVSPEAYLRALAAVALDLMDGKQPPETIEMKPTKLKAAEDVSDDDPKAMGLGDLSAGLPRAGNDAAGQAAGVDVEAGVARPATGSGCGPRPASIRPAGEQRQGQTRPPSRPARR